MDPDAVKRKLTAILNADVVAYSALIAEDEEKKRQAMRWGKLAVALAAWVVALTPAVSTGQQFGTGYVMEMRKLLGELFPRLVYACSSECTPEQFAAIPVPTGWEKSIPKEMLPIAAGMPYPPPLGELPAVDYIPEIPGAEFALVAKLLGGALLSASPQIVVAQIERSTVFTYEAGKVVHEVTDPDSNRYILFVVAIELIGGGLDPTQLDAFDSLVLPDGWTYASRTLAGDLVVDSEGVATVFSHSGLTTWQLYARTSSIPLLSPAATYGLAFLIAGVGWAFIRRRQRGMSFSHQGE